jgi:hypothetical protein
VPPYRLNTVSYWNLEQVWQSRVVKLSKYRNNIGISYSLCGYSERKRIRRNYGELIKCMHALAREQSRESFTSADF